ncbi:type I phosphomannose isomerase catalytic subunit [Apibacter sp. HY039]|uniref:type I phosphomannose isomerase catalytic subunit n=1 Tax=Apibacter sp. HY039 TaxID=2501476 RepID=UPI000FEB7714|nr:type I phosphomannose isomerase catalytic subunit [Apibacter sp. HY039]
MSLYPLLFQPSYHYRIWGGNKLTAFGKKITEENIGESWEISTVPGFVSKIANGAHKGRNLNDLITEYKEKLLGTEVYKKFGLDFPLLIKFLDADAPLSVQVHPDDAYAKKYHNSFGKTEMWYVLESDPESEIIVGFEPDVNKEIFLQKEKEGEIESVLRKIHPQKGDVVYIPAGRVHALGKGIMVAEIQQTSDITYRIYDYNRVDKDGKKRELHLQQAADVSDFSYIKDPFIHYNKTSDNELLVQSPYFTTSKKIIHELLKIEKLTNTFKIIIILEGKGVLESESGQIEINKGQTVLLPASLDEVTIKSLINQPLTLLEVHI